ncbi:hypothetical protein CPLU01_15058 [Colletotrichum plurivorum]|uniref:Uncharacterized protein n=1 Tax=Colletotrichum plurivorum TaxID=2175906 RepID=A0A8H6JFN5_9PEZI|nr:hypothetical protein CPLU01_15058 [Colletotrichum plurivorum]
MALHHVEDPESAVKKLAARLKPGGKILVIDWTPERIEGALKTHAASQTISKPKGFTEEETRNMFEDAGCKGMAWKLAEELSRIPVIDGLKSQLYFASATKE